MINISQLLVFPGFGELNGSSAARNTSVPPEVATGGLSLGCFLTSHNRRCPHRPPTGIANILVLYINNAIDY
jgi:hypothetical protein